MAPKQRGHEVRAVRHADFVRDASKVMRRAENDGPVVITNAQGAPRMVICIPTDKRAVED